MGNPRYVVLRFDDGDRFDYDPPLPHPADVFLERFGESHDLNADIGATSAAETKKTRPDGGAIVVYPPRRRPPNTWIDKP